jgi:processed acidic surface protein
MKKLGVVLSIVSVLMMTIVQTVYASEITSSAAETGTASETGGASETETAAGTAETTSERASEPDLTAYLNEVSTTRGFTVSEDDIDLSLFFNGKTQDEFSTTDELSTFLGDVITADLSNLDGLYSEYALNQDTLVQLLNEYGEDINDYVFIKDLDLALAFYTENAGNDNDVDLSNIDLSMYMAILSQLGLTEDEIMKLDEHFQSLTDYLATPQVAAQMEDLANRIMNFTQDMVAKGMENPDYKPSRAEINELASLIDEGMKALKLNIVFTMTENGVEMNYTLQELFNLEEINETDFKVAFYDDASNLLGDIEVTSEFIKSYIGEIEDANHTATDSNNADNKAGSVKQVSTVKGGKLPVTAGNYISYILLGLIIAMTGMVVYWKSKNAEGDLNQK